MWYSASLLFKGEHTPPRDDVLWEESIRLISAATENEAVEKAQHIGKAQELSYPSEGGVLTWIFDRVERICTIEQDQMSDGSEIFSRFLRESEVESLLTPFDDEQ